MYYHGSFFTQSDETVTVHIVTGNSRAAQVEIGDENAGVFFAPDPVEIESSVNDTFDCLLRSRATVRLLTGNFLQDLFCESRLDAAVNIFKGGKCVFAGFVEPQAYSQPYNEVYDELEITCIDVLSALQYAKYRSVGSAGVSYAEVKAAAARRTFKDLIFGTLADVCSGLDIAGAGGFRCLYDGSKALDADDSGDIFARLAVSELLFLGDNEDDTWSQDDVLSETLKYLNLHIVQDGLSFYVFSWESVTSGASIPWRDIVSGAVEASDKTIVDIRTDIMAGTDTAISIGETFNQIALTCEVKNVENVIESPLDTDVLMSPYTAKQKYLTEYSSDGEGERAYDAFYAMTHGQNTDYAGGVITDWYVRVKDNPNWIFPECGSGESLTGKYCKDNASQQNLPNRLRFNPGAAILSLGKVEHKTSKDDNAPVSRVSMDDYLVISVNGNGVDNQEHSTYPSEETLKDNAPMAVYSGPVSGGIYSPSDGGATNYIVISGRIALNPLMEFTAPYKTLHDTDPWPNFMLPGSFWHQTVPSRTNKDGRYYTQRFYRADTPHDAPEWDGLARPGLSPFTGTGPEQYEFKYSAVGDRTDTVSKIAALACMLVIGDKCLVEKQPGETLGTETPGTGNGQIGDFVWLPYKTRGQCLDDDEYYGQSFTIGFDPKIGDKLIGTEFDLQNNIDYTLGLDAEGTAIPVRKSDKLAGAVKFMILGPVNTVWDEITRRHKTWFRHTKWGEKSVPLLAHVSSIFVKSFEIKIYSDNGLIENVGDNDLVYMSDTRETFVNRKDDISFRISSALTLEECRHLGVPETVSLSTPIDLSTGYGVLSIYDRNKAQQAKAEQLYVDSYYKECHRPRVIMTQKLEDSPETTGLFHHYRHPAMADKKFYVQGISRNLIEGCAELTLKEIWHDWH